MSGTDWFRQKIGWRQVNNKCCSTNPDSLLFPVDSDWKKNTPPPHSLQGPSIGAGTDAAGLQLAVRVTAELLLAVRVTAGLQLAVRVTAELQLAVRVTTGLQLAVRVTAELQLAVRVTTGLQLAVRVTAELQLAVRVTAGLQLAVRVSCAGRYRPLMAGLCRSL